MFQFYNDEEMTVPAGALISQVFDLGGKDEIRHVLYFGSPDKGKKLQTAENGGVYQITLTPHDVAPTWQSQTGYELDALVAMGNMIYQCVNAGVSADEPPLWLETTGAVIQDNTVIWRCIGKRHLPDALKLALSENGLNSAVGGASLALGTELLGGAPVAVHFSIKNNVSDTYIAEFLPQIGVKINDCVVLNHY